MQNQFQYSVPPPPIFFFSKSKSYYFGEFALLVQFMNRTTSGIVLSEFVLSGDPLSTYIQISKYV